MLHVVRRSLPLTSPRRFLTPASSSALTDVIPPVFDQFHRSFSNKSQSVTVLYDGLCPICMTEIQLLQYLQINRPEQAQFVDISVPGYDGEKYKGVSYEMAMEEMHVIDENHKVHRGIPAFAVMYRAVGLGWVGSLMMWPPVRPLLDQAYAIFARNRLRWTGRSDACKTESCAKKTR